MIHLFQKTQLGFPFSLSEHRAWSQKKMCQVQCFAKLHFMWWVSFCVKKIL